MFFLLLLIFLTESHSSMYIHQQQRSMSPYITDPGRQTWRKEIARRPVGVAAADRYTEKVRQHHRCEPASRVRPAHGKAPFVSFRDEVSTLQPLLLGLCWARVGVGDSRCWGPWQRFRTIQSEDNGRRRRNKFCKKTQVLHEVVRSIQQPVTRSIEASIDLGHISWSRSSSCSPAALRGCA